LGLLGIAAFEDKRFQDAIDAWTQLSKGLDPQDPSYQAIQTGIDRARNSLAETPQPAIELESTADEVTGAATVNDFKLLIEVKISDELAKHVAATATVFVFARPESGPPMPLAAKRFAVADLPASIALTDADSLLPDLKLSSIGRLKLQASISNSGDAMQAQWSSEAILVDATEEDAKHVLLIDQKK
jgi:cytochrome c-type biogenesis protein CcmH